MEIQETSITSRHVWRSQMESGWKFLIEYETLNNVLVPYSQKINAQKENASDNAYICFIPANRQMQILFSPNTAYDAEVLAFSMEALAAINAKYPAPTSQPDNEV